MKLMNVDDLNQKFVRAVVGPYPLEGTNTYPLLTKLKIFVVDMCTFKDFSEGIQSS